MAFLTAVMQVTARSKELPLDFMTNRATFLTPGRRAGWLRVASWWLVECVEEMFTICYPTCGLRIYWHILTYHKYIYIYIICIYTHIASFRAQHDLKPSGCGWSGRNWRSGRVVGNIVLRVSIVERPSNCSSPASLTMPPNAPKCPSRCSSCTRRVMRKWYSFLLIYPLVIFVRTFTNL